VSKRILVLVHKQLVPPENFDEKKINWDFCDWVTEYDVIQNLKKLGHQVLTLGVISDLRKIRDAIEKFEPHIVFNLMEMFDGEVIFDQNVVSYLQLLRMPFTGCNPRGLILARDKALTKKILKYHRVLCPNFFTFPRNKKIKTPKHMQYPMIVKCLHEEASYGIAQASVVTNEEKLLERVRYIHTQLYDDAIVEQFIEGKEYYCAVLGNYKLKTFPLWELKFENSENPEKEFYTRSAKFNEKYRSKKGILTKRADIDPELEEKIQKICKKVYRLLGLNGYARIDLRVADDGKVYILEANPNPDISMRDDFSSSAKFEKVEYQELLTKILSLGLSWHNKYD